MEDRSTRHVSRQVCMSDSRASCRQTVSSGSDAQIGPFPFWGQPLLLQDGHLWSQLQRPRRLTFPRRISDWVKSPRSSRQRWSLVGRWHILRCIHDTHPLALSPDAAMHEGQGRRWRGAWLARQQDSALSVIAAAVPRSEPSAWRGTGPPSHRTQPILSSFYHMSGTSASSQPLLTHGILPLP